MAQIADAYAKYRVSILNISPAARAAFAKKREGANNLVDIAVKRYLTNAVLIPRTWQELKDRIRAMTRERGARAELARNFNVSPAAVSQWLSGASSPEANTTIQLLKWVAAKESEAKQQQEGAGTVGAEPAPKTRKSKSTSHEKAKSDRKKQ